MSDVIFQPLGFKNLTVKNRIFRSNIAGRFDNCDGSGTHRPGRRRAAGGPASRLRRGHRARQVRFNRQ